MKIHVVTNEGTLIGTFDSEEDFDAECVIKAVGFARSDLMADIARALRLARKQENAEKEQERILRFGK